MHIASACWRLSWASLLPALFASAIYEQARIIINAPVTAASLTRKLNNILESADEDLNSIVTVDNIYHTNFMLWYVLQCHHAHLCIKLKHMSIRTPRFRQFTLLNKFGQVASIVARMNTSSNKPCINDPLSHLCLLHLQLPKTLWMWTDNTQPVSHCHWHTFDKMARTERVIARKFSYTSFSEDSLERMNGIK